MSPSSGRGLLPTRLAPRWKKALRQRPGFFNRSRARRASLQKTGWSTHYTGVPSSQVSGGSDRASIAWVELRYWPSEETPPRPYHLVDAAAERNVTAPAADKPTVLSRQTGVSLGLILAALAPLIVSVAFVVTVNERCRALQKAQIQQEISWRAELQALRAELKEHKDQGVDGVPHPVGAQVAINQLRRDLAEQAGNRWSRADDKAYMSEFARLNNLQCPDHRRVDE